MNNNEILLRTTEKERDLLKENLKNIKNELIKENEALRNENDKMREQLDSILYSRSYKIAQKLKKIIKR